MSQQEIAVTLGLLPIVLFAGVYVAHLVRQARRIGAAEKTAHSDEYSIDEVHENAILTEELRGVRLELRALREVLERGEHRQR